MWTVENRPIYNRDHLRYPSDLTDKALSLIEPLMPPAKPGEGKRRTNMRELRNGLLYILSTGCQWRYLQKILHPKAPYTIILVDGMRRAFWMKSTILFAYTVENRQIERYLQGFASSTVKALRAPF